MNQSQNLVHEFQVAFGQQTNPQPTDLGRVSGVWELRMGLLARDLRARAANPGSNEGKQALLRLQLMQEELAEVAGAMVRGDWVNLLQELADLQYVLDGTILALGLSDAFGDAFREVHRANMSKLEDGRPVVADSGRVVKGKDYRPPNILDVWRQHYDQYPDDGSGPAA